MKKLKMIAMTTLGLAVIGGGSLFYLTQMVSYDTADEKVDEVVADEYEIVLPGENEEIVDKDSDVESKTTDGNAAGDSIAGSSETSGVATTTSSQSQKTSAGQATENTDEQADTNENSSEQSQKSDPKTGSDKSTSTQQPKSEADADKDGAAIIVAKYEPSFEELQSQANAKIDSLMDYAYGEYKTKKSNGEKISYLQFYSKYTAAGNVLEKKTDETFDYIYGALVKELNENGFEASHAERFRTAYEDAKKERRSAILKKATEQL